MGVGFLDASLRELSKGVWAARGRSQEPKLLKGSLSLFDLCRLKSLFCSEISFLPLISGFRGRRPSVLARAAALGSAGIAAAEGRRGHLEGETGRRGGPAADQGSVCGSGSGKDRQRVEGAAEQGVRESGGGTGSVAKETETASVAKETGVTGIRSAAAVDDSLLCTCVLSMPYSLVLLLT